jgi:hypothetical protein
MVVKLCLGTLYLKHQLMSEWQGAAMDAAHDIPAQIIAGSCQLVGVVWLPYFIVDLYNRL